MSKVIDTPEYGLNYEDKPPHSQYVWNPVKMVLKTATVKSVLDVGCGTGRFCEDLVKDGYDAYGIDASKIRIKHGLERYDNIMLKEYSIYDNYRFAFDDVDGFDAIVSMEVVEHLYSPEEFISRANAALRPGGVIVLSTPYHGYIKNLVLAGTGKMDSHFTALWEGGHIKFWSKKTLGELLEKGGFKNIGFIGCGRFPFLWKSMVMWGVKRKE